MANETSKLAEKLAQAFVLSPEPVGLFDLHTLQLTTNNLAFEQFFGKNCSNLKEVVPSEFQSALNKFVDDLREHKGTFLQCRLNAVDGHSFEAFLHGYLSEGGEALLVVSDISREVQRKEEESQKKWIRYFEHFYANTKDIVNLFSLTQRKILRWNPQACEILGYSKGDLENLRIEELYPPEELLKLGATFQRLVEKGFVEEKLKFYNKARELQDIWIRAFVVQYEPETLCLVHTIDITKEKEHEAALLKEARLAALGEASATLAHEINNSLQSIQFDIYFLEKMRDQLPEQAVKRLNTIEKNALHIESVVRNIQNYTHFSQSGNSATFISPIIDGTIQIMEGYLKSHQVDVTCNIEPNLPPVLVDLNQIQQILLVLIKNAAQAMGTSEQKKLVITARLGAQKSVELLVTDTGRGIPASIRERLFDAFVTTKASGFGLGLGLSVAKKLANANNVDINFTSEEGVGTEFSLVFKLAGDNAGENALGNSQYVLLYIDDKESLMPSFVDHLSTMGITVIRARTAKDACKILLNHKIDIVMCIENTYPLPGHAIAKEVKNIFLGPICILLDPKIMGNSSIFDNNELDFEIIYYPCDEDLFIGKIKNVLERIKKDGKQKIEVTHT